MIEIKKKISLFHGELSYKINGMCFQIQKELGRFAREKQYADLMEEKLKENNIVYRRELVVGDSANRPDFLIEDVVVVEFKAKPFIVKEDYYQVQRYLQTLNLELGIIYNFRDSYIKPKRILRPGNKNP